MSLIVQKFGGTSVADSQKILGAARRAIRAGKTGTTCWSWSARWARTPIC